MEENVPVMHNVRFHILVMKKSNDQEKKKKAEAIKSPLRINLRENNLKIRAVRS